MALPAGVAKLGSFQGGKGDKGDTGTIAYATAETVPADQPADVVMVGSSANRGAAFKIPRGLPGVNAIPTDEAMATYLGAPDTASGSVVSSKIDGAISPKLQGILAPLSTDMGALQLEAYLNARVNTPRVPSNLWYGHLMNPKLKDAFGRVITGTGIMKILCVGDSTTYGAGATMPDGYVNQNSWPSRMAQYLDRNVATSIYGLVIPPSDGSSVPERLVDSRWTLGAGWARAVNVGVGFGGKNSNYRGMPGGGALTFADPRVTANRFDIYYTTITSSTLGTFTAQATGGAPVVVQEGNQPTRTIKKVTISAGSLSRDNVLSITNTGSTGNVYIVGVEAYAEGAPRIRVSNAGSSGSSTGSWLAKSGTGELATDDWNYFTFMPAYEPDLVIIDLGINDASSVSVETYIANIQRLADAAAAAGAAVLIKTMIPSGGAEPRPTREAEYVAALKTQLNPRYAILDLFTHYGSYARNVARGWMTDTLHGGDDIYLDEGALVAEALFRYSGH